MYELATLVPASCPGTRGRMPGWRRLLRRGDGVGRISAAYLASPVLCVEGCFGVSNLLLFAPLTPRGFKGRAFSPKPPLGARPRSGPGEKLLQWMELVTARLPSLGTPGFHSFPLPLFWRNGSLPVRPEDQASEPGLGKPITEPRAGGRPGFQPRSEIEKDRRRAACTDS